MFNWAHYVPVIRWKAGERWALRNLQPRLRRRITPLLELIPKNFESKKLAKARGAAGRMTNIAQEIVDSWGRTPFFLDTMLIDDAPELPSRPHPLRLLGDGMRSQALKGIPVTGIGRSSDQKDAARSVGADLECGIAVRVFRNELGSSLAASLESLLDRLDTTRREVDLIVDQQILDGTALSGTALLRAIPELGEWRTVTLLGGAFPRDLSELEKNTQPELPRTEWQIWRACTSAQPKLARMPTFGDYTVQHALYCEPPSGFNMSASIRYTSDTYWVIMRGEGVRNDDGPGYDGFLGNAMLLVDRDEFCNPSFSAGDRYIYEMSRQSAKTGNAKTWIQAAINHHLTFAARQIANLSAS